MIFRNTVAQTAVLVTAYAFSFLLAPIMLARLGLAQFGVWAVTGAFATYAGLMDLGITRALGRFVALYHAQGDRRAVEQCFTLGGAGHGLGLHCRYCERPVRAAGMADGANNVYRRADDPGLLALLADAPPGGVLLTAVPEEALLGATA